MFVILVKADEYLENKITDIKDLNSAQKNEITFLHSKKYADLAKKTNASYCLTSENFKSQVMNEILGNVQGMMPKLLDKGLPDVTGESLPIPKGLGI